MLLRIVHFIERITGSVGIAAGWLIVPLVLATCYEVFSRYVLNAPTIWAFDVGYMLTGSHFLLGGALTLRERGHIRIDVLYNRFSERTKAVVDALGFFVLALPVTFLVSAGLWDYALDAYMTEELTGQSAWNPVVWPFRLVFFAGFFLLALQAIAELLKSCLTFAGKQVSVEAG